jgi:hypothetical protein
MSTLKLKVATLFAAGATITGLGLVAAGAASASGSPAGVAHPNVVSTTKTGLAGYYVNDKGGWRIRDVKVTYRVTTAMEQLGYTASISGAVGTRQCDPNTLAAVDVGTLWNGTNFSAAYGHGTAGGSAPDPCVTTPALSGGAISFPGNVNVAGVNVGDVITQEQYFNPKTHWETLTYSDVTQDTTSQVHFYEGWKNFYEAGPGVLDLNANVLAAPVLNNVVTFTGRMTNYGGPAKSSFAFGEDLHAVTALNAANVPVLIPSALSNGNKTFSVAAGVDTTP